MATTQNTIAATNVDSVAMGADATRRWLYIRNYSSATLNVGQTTMFVAFGKIATAGTGGELEIVAGGEYMWEVVGEIPLEAVHVITASGGANGCVMSQ